MEALQCREGDGDDWRAAIIAKMEEIGAQVIPVYGLTQVYGPYSR
jgi:hypothetical protein